jgi:hypothetical protein
MEKFIQITEIRAFVESLPNAGSAPAFIFGAAAVLGALDDGSTMIPHSKVERAARTHFAVAQSFDYAAGVESVAAFVLGQERAGELRAEAERQAIGVLFAGDEP